MSSDPRDLSHELRAAPEPVGAAGDAQNGWMASISRPFLVRFCDFEFPAALAHFFGFKLETGPRFPGKCGGLVAMCHCGNVPQAHARRVAGGWAVSRESLEPLDLTPLPGTHPRSPPRSCGGMSKPAKPMQAIIDSRAPKGPIGPHVVEVTP